MPDARRPALTLALLCVAQFVDVMGVTIAVVALPSIERDLGFAGADVQWVVSAYALVFAGFLIVAGGAADRYGRRRLFQVGLAVFAGGSLACGLAGSPLALVVARGLQGLGAAIAVPAALSLLTATFAQPAQRARALAAWTAAAAGGGASGFVIGGLITAAAGWQWVFLVNVPISLAALVATRFIIARDVARGSGARPDLAGAATVTAGLVLVVYGLSAFDGDFRAVLLPLIAGAAALILFAVIERRVAAPLAPGRVVMVRAVVAACLIGAVLTAVTSPASVLATIYLQDTQGYGPGQAGLTLVPFSLGVIAGSVAGSTVVSRRGPRAVIVGGLVAVTIAMGLATAISSSGGALYLLAALALAGVGLGSASVAATGIGVAAVDGADAGIASGLLNTSAQVGTAVGLSLLLAIAGTGHAGAQSGNAAIADGIQTAYAAAGGLAAAGLAAALVLLRSHAPPRSRSDSPHTPHAPLAHARHTTQSPRRPGRST